MITTDCHILIADDVSTARSITKAQLRKIGFSDLTEAASGTRALEILRHMPVDLVIADWGMPDMTGLELAATMKQEERLKHVPILMLSAESSRQIIIEAMDAGVDGYIIKPHTTAKLTESIIKISRRERQQIQQGIYLGPKPRRLTQEEGPVRIRPSRVGVL